MGSFFVVEGVRPGCDLLMDEARRSSVLLRRVGGEMIGYEVYDPGSGRPVQLLWNPPPGDDHAWRGPATILFPVVGGLWKGSSHCRETWIRQPIHGFAQQSAFRLVQAYADEEGAELTYRLGSSDSSREGYPFDFCFDLTYRLDKGGVSLVFSIAHEGPGSLFFQCGWHPGFATPGGFAKDWELRFPAGTARRWHCQPEGGSFLTGRVEAMDLGELALKEEDLNATVFLELPDPSTRICRLKQRSGAKGLDLLFPDFPYLALWNQPGREFLCIEPCQGLDDHREQEPFDRKVGIVELTSGQTLQRHAALRPFFRDRLA